MDEQGGGLKENQLFAQLQKWKASWLPTFFKPGLDSIPTIWNQASQSNIYPPAEALLLVLDKPMLQGPTEGQKVIEKLREGRSLAWRKE